MRRYSVVVVRAEGVLLLVEDEHALEAAILRGVRRDEHVLREVSQLQRLARACQRLVHVALELPLAAHLLHQQRHPSRGERGADIGPIFRRAWLS